LRSWLSGVVVVAAAGQLPHDRRPSGVPFAPGNDPFVITSAPADIHNTISSADDNAALFSAYGLRRDGFRSRRLGAGPLTDRPMPANATIAT